MGLNPFRVGRRYIDNNIGSYEFHIALNTSQDFDTLEGKAISEEIRKKVQIAEMELILAKTARIAEASGMRAKELLYIECPLSISGQHLHFDHRGSIPETYLQLLVE
jgi:hypothetical protein